MLQLSQVQAVAFDLDGTLVDSVPDLAAAANAMRQELGLEILEREIIQSYVGDGMASLVHRALTNDMHGMAEESLWQQGYTAFVKYYASHIAHATRPYPHTETALGLLQLLGIPLAVITNKSELLAVKLLKDLNLAHYFSIIIGGDTVSERKPSPKPLRYVAEVLGVETQNMLMVGDSANDIMAAKAAHCPSVCVTYGYGDVKELTRIPETRPDWIIQSLTDIYDHLCPQKDVV